MIENSIEDLPEIRYIYYPTTYSNFNKIDINPSLPLAKSINSFIKDQNPLYTPKKDNISYVYFNQKEQTTENKPSQIKKSLPSYPNRSKINARQKNLHVLTLENLAYSTKIISLSTEKEPEDNRTKKSIYSYNTKSYNTIEYSDKRPLDKSNNRTKPTNEFKKKIELNDISIIFKRNNAKKKSIPLDNYQNIKKYTHQKNIINLKINCNKAKNKKNRAFLMQTFDNIKKEKNICLSNKRDPIDIISFNIRDKNYSEKSPSDTAKFDSEKNMDEDIGNILIKEEKETKTKKYIDLTNKVICKNKLIKLKKKYLTETEKNISQDKAKFLNKKEIKMLKFMPLNKRSYF